MVHVELSMADNGPSCLHCDLSQEVTESRQAGGRLDYLQECAEGSQRPNDFIRITHHLFVGIVMIV